MNPAGCDAMMFSDQVFILPRVDGIPTCDKTLYEFWVLGGILIGVKALGLLGRIRLFRIRLGRERTRNTHVAQHMLRRHLPVGALLDACSLVIYILTVVLCGLDIANSTNGVSFALAGLCFIPFAIGYTLHYVRMVSLGSKVIPQALNSVDNTNLSNFTFFNKLWTVLQLASLMVLILTSVILAPVLPDYAHQLFQVGTASMGVFIFSCSFAVMYQMERCVRAIGKVVDQVQGLLMDHNPVRNAIHRLRIQQLASLFIALPICLFVFCYAVNLIEWSATYVLIVMFSDALGGLVVVMNASIRNPFCQTENNELSSTQLSPKITSKIGQQQSNPDAAKLYAPSLLI